MQTGTEDVFSVVQNERLVFKHNEHNSLPVLFIFSRCPHHLPAH